MNKNFLDRKENNGLNSENRMIVLNGKKIKIKGIKKRMEIKK